MVGYMNLEERVDREFRLARTKALLGRIAARLRRRDVASTRLPRFEEVRRISGALGGIHRGMRTVPVERVLGSVGRRSEFDRGFMPARASVEGRWKRIDRAFHRGEELPPVSLYELGRSYYVLDGHNRVSVARFHGVEWIDAHVTEFRASRLVARRGATTSIETRASGAREMMDPYEIMRQHREEVARVVERNRLAGELRAGRKRRAGGRKSALMWELKRVLGRLFKPFGR
jgi:hypothetical protein